MRFKSHVTHPIVLAAAILLSRPLHAQDTSVIIDLRLKNCLEQSENETTAGMRNCINTAYKAMDQRLNEVYKALLAQLSPEQKEGLKDAQRKWLTFRDAEIKFAVAFNEGGGTLALVTNDNNAYEILKQRTKDLEQYLNSLDEK